MIDFVCSYSRVTAFLICISFTGLLIMFFAFILDKAKFIRIEDLSELSDKELDHYHKKLFAMRKTLSSTLKEALPIVGDIFHNKKTIKEIEIEKELHRVGMEFIRRKEANEEND